MNDCLIGTMALIIVALLVLVIAKQNEADTLRENLKTVADMRDFWAKESTKHALQAERLRTEFDVNPFQDEKPQA